MQIYPILIAISLVSVSLESAQARVKPAPSSRALLEPLARVIAQAVGVDQQIAVALITQESQWNPMVISNKGAMGLTQLMPKTAAAYGVRNPYDPVENMITGLYHYKLLFARYQDHRLALAAYNAGEGAVAKYKGIPPYRETINYVRQILARSNDGQAAPSKNVENPDNISEPNAITPYEADTPLDLSSFNATDIPIPQQVTVEPQVEPSPTVTVETRSAPR